MEAKRGPMEPKEGPSGSQRDAKRFQGSPGDPKGIPREAQVEAKGGPMEPKGSPKAPWAQDLATWIAKCGNPSFSTARPPK